MILQNGCAKISLPALREEFTRLREWLESIIAEVSVPQRAARQLLIAADEIFTNVASYAYPDKTGSVTVKAEYSPAENVLKLHFFDNGIPFNPLQSPEADTTLPPEERTLGGLGITVVKKMMDLVEYEYADGANHLTLTKNFTPAEEVKP